MSHGCLSAVPRETNGTFSVSLSTSVSTHSSKAEPVPFLPLVLKQTTIYAERRMVLAVLPTAYGVIRWREALRFLPLHSKGSFVHFSERGRYLHVLLGTGCRAHESAHRLLLSVQVALLYHPQLPDETYIPTLVTSPLCRVAIFWLF